MNDPTTHLTDRGEPCTAHERASLDNLLALALIGSRVAAFNHDIASKLQGVMMALDEVSELLESRPDPDLARAVEAANTSLQETNALLGQNRALTRTTRSKISLRELVEQAAARAHVAIRGEVLDGTVEARLGPLTLGVALALDVAAGAGRDRTLAVQSSRVAERAELAFAAMTPAPKSAGDHLVLASFALEQAGGELRCTADQRLVIRIPLVP